MTCRAAVRLPPLPRRRESDLVAEALRFLNRIPGVVAWRTNVGAVSADHKGKRRFVRFGFPGLSDIIGWKTTDTYTPFGYVRYPRFLAVECKSVSGVITPQQQGFLDLVEKSGGIGFVARSCDDIAARMALR